MGHGHPQGVGQSPELLPLMPAQAGWGNPRAQPLMCTSTTDHPPECRELPGTAAKTLCKNPCERQNMVILSAGWKSGEEGKAHLDKLVEHRIPQAQHPLCHGISAPLPRQGRGQQLCQDWDKLAALSQPLAVLFTGPSSSARGKRLRLKRRKTLRSPKLTYYKGKSIGQVLIIPLNTNPTIINSFQRQLNSTEVALTY